MRPIVTQDTVIRLSRRVLLLLCVLYAIPGFFGHDPWRDNEALALERMLAPLGTYTDFTTLLGQAALAVFSGLLGVVNASRVPGALLLWGSFAMLWYACYQFARAEEAQPAELPFGGQAHSVDYARTVADGALLAFMACIGLAEKGHQSTALLGELFGVVTLLYGLASYANERYKSPIAILVSAILLSGFGAAAFASLLYLALLSWWGLSYVTAHEKSAALSNRALLIALAAAAVICACAWIYAPAHWAQVFPLANDNFLPDASGLLSLSVWFLWPLWIIVIFGLWRLRNHGKTQTPMSKDGMALRPQARWFAWPSWAWHYCAPLFVFTAVALRAAFSADQDSALFIGLPALAIAAALMLALMPRSVLAAVDWFALALFTGTATFLWLLWLAAQTGIPVQISNNIDRFYPGFRETNVWPFQTFAFVLAVCGTLAWLALMVWRTSRARKPLWKGMVLTAGGVTLTWLLLQTLGGPMLNASRSYKQLALSIDNTVPRDACVKMLNVAQTQQFLLRFEAKTRYAQASEACEYALVQLNRTRDVGADKATGPELSKSWKLLWTVHRPSDREETYSLYKRSSVGTSNIADEPASTGTPQ